MLYGTPPFAVLSAFPLWQSIQHSPVRISSSAFHFGRHDEIGKRVIRIILHDSLSPELPVFLIEPLPMEEVGQIALFFRALSVGTSYTAELIRGFLQKGVRLFLVHAGFLSAMCNTSLLGGPLSHQRLGQPVALTREDHDVRMVDETVYERRCQPVIAKNSIPL